VIVLSSLKFFVLVALSLFLLGCSSNAPSPSPTAVATVSPSASVLPTSVPSASVTATPAPSITEVNYSTRTELVSAYLNALKDGDYAKAYSLVSGEFKKEDSTAFDLASFERRIKQDSAIDSFSDVVISPESKRMVLASVSFNGSAAKSRESFIVAFENGFWKVRVPFSTKGYYYNLQTKLVYTAGEVSRFVSNVLSALYSAGDPSLSKQPFEFGVFDQAKGIYFGERKIRLSRAGFPARDSAVSIFVGPAVFVDGYATTSAIADGREFTYQYLGSAFAGGDGAFQCYSGTPIALRVTFKMSTELASYYSNVNNPFNPLFTELVKACPG